MRKFLIIIAIIAVLIIAYQIFIRLYYKSTAKNVSEVNSVVVENSENEIDIASDEVREEKITFKNEDSNLNLSGIIFTPSDFDSSKKYLAIVVTGPMLSVKEQAQSIYAKRLAQNGYVTMVFDYSYFGESEGEPRYLENPEVKSSDIHSAVSYLETLDYVDSEKIAGVGICGSGSYMPYAATTDDRIKVVASIVPGTTMDTFIYKSLDEVEQDRIAYESGNADPTYIDLMPRAYAEGAAYYYNKDRGYRDNWSNQAVSWSEEYFVNFHPTQSIVNLTVPYIVLTGENAWSKSGAKELYENTSSEIKEYHEIEGAGHFDMYDLEPYVTENIDYILEFFNNNL